MLIDSRSGVLSPPTGQPFAKTVLVATVKVPAALKSGSNYQERGSGDEAQSAWSSVQCFETLAETHVQVTSCMAV